MKINLFRAQNVHSYLNFDISFFQDLTFLIGINGAGKTSVLKLILGLTSPSFYNLSQIDYDFCEVVCSSTENEQDIVIRSVQNKTNNTFVLHLEMKNELFKLESEPIRRLPKSEETHLDSDDFIAIEQRYKELFETIEITQKIRELTTPKFLGLDRKIYEGKNIDYRYRQRRFGNKFRRKTFESYQDSSAIDVSLEDVQHLVYDFIRRIAQNQLQISEKFKQKIFNQTFSYTETGDFVPIPVMDELIDRRKEVLNAIENLGLTYLDWSVNNFFNKIESIVTENEKYGNKSEILAGDISSEYITILLKWSNNSTQLKRIDDIISYSQEYQREIAELKAPLKRLQMIVTNFLTEGNKKLKTEDDGEIKIELKNGRKANLYELSSGEKQIIIMIAHLIFEEDQGSSGIFIIDEPELSLHIAWQEIFVDSIMQASPKTQFILATHSPSIIAKVDKEKYCQDLNKLNTL